MLSAALLLFANTLLFSLRLSGGGSFQSRCPPQRSGISPPLRPGRSGGPGCTHRAEPAPGGPHHQEILYPERRSGGPDLHRHHRPHQGHLQLRPGRRAPAWPPTPPAALKTKFSCTSAARKSSREKSLCRIPIETDKEGNALQLMNVVGVDDTMLDDIHDRDSALRLHQIIRGASDHPGGGDHSPAVRAGRHHPPDPEGNCRLLRDFPVLCIPHRKAGAGKAAPGAAGRPCAPAGPAEAPSSGRDRRIWKTGGRDGKFPSRPFVRFRAFQ